MSDGAMTEMQDEVEIGGRRYECGPERQWQYVGSRHLGFCRGIRGLAGKSDGQAAEDVANRARHARAMMADFDESFQRGESAIAS